MSRTLCFVIAALSLLASGAIAQENQVLARSNVARGTTRTQQKFDLTGTITDQKTNVPLAGATIYIPDLHTGAVADENGHFTITSISAGNYIIEISYLGYASIAKSITINGNLQFNVALSATILEQQGVTVTGVTFATRTKQNPQVVNILKYDDLLGISSTNIMDALAKAVPGVSIVSTGPAVSKPFIRGLGYNRVVVVNDGVRQEGQQWGDEHGIEIDDYSAQRIEVLKGPSSLMYGSDAIAGVINIQTQTPVPEGTMKVNVLSEYQSNNALRAIYGNLAGTKNGFSWNAYADYKGAHDYKNAYDGYVYNSKFWSNNVGGMVGYRGNWGSSRLLISHVNQHIGMVEGERDETTGAFLKPLPGGEESIAMDDDFKQVKPGIPYQQIGHFKITSDNIFQLGKNHLDVTIGYQQNKRQEFGSADEPDVPEAFFDLKTVTYAVRYHLPAGNSWKTAFGVNGMFQENTNRAEEAIIPDYALQDAGVFFFSQHIKDKFSFSGGLRVDYRNISSKSMIVDGEPKFSALNMQFSNISGSAGITYQLAPTVAVKANLARGFRAPNLAELASNGAHEGTNRYEIGNADLKNEVSMQGDLGLELTADHITFSAAVFYNHINDFIFYQKVLAAGGGDSVLTDPESGNTLQVFRFNQQDANLYGAELHIDIHPHPLDWLHFENTFSYTRGKFTSAVDGSTDLPHIPAARLVSELRGNLLKKSTSFKNVHVSITGDYTFRQDKAFTGFNTETPTDGYFLLNAAAGAEIMHRGNVLFGIHIGVFNITDAAYQNHLSRLKYTAVNNATGRAGVFDMGRNFSIKINVPLSYKL